MNSSSTQLSGNVRAQVLAPRRAMSGPALLACFLWCAYLLACPFYFLPSGQPQIADYVMVALFAWVMLFRGLVVPARSMPVLGCVSLLVAYIACINAVRYLQAGDAEILKYLLYYVFNWLAVVTFLVLYQWAGRPLAGMTGGAVFASLTIQALLSQGGFYSQLSRGTAFFNNPNQLGYFVTLFCSMFWVWSQSVKKRRPLLLAAEVCLFLAAVFLVGTSHSRASLAALGLLLVLRLLMRASAPLLAASIALALLLPQFDLDLSQSVRERFAERSKSVADEYHYRGYDRIGNHPEYLLLGAGEGAYWRFDSELAAELHSSFGTVLFCYGIVGSALFARLFWLVGKACGPRSLLYFLPLAAYGLAHNGLRQTEFWLLFAMLVCLHPSAAAPRAPGRDGRASPPDRARRLSRPGQPAAARWPLAADDHKARSD